jgi:hypothetical protein
MLSQSVTSAAGADDQADRFLIESLMALSPLETFCWEK